MNLEVRFHTKRFSEMTELPSPWGTDLQTLNFCGVGTEVLCSFKISLSFHHECFSELALNSFPYFMGVGLPISFFFADRYISCHLW